MLGVRLTIPAQGFDRDLRGLAHIPPICPTSAEGQMVTLLLGLRTSRGGEARSLRAELFALTLIS